MRTLSIASLFFTILFSCNSKNISEQTADVKDFLIVKDTLVKSVNRMCIDTIKITELLSFIENTYNSDSIIRESMQVVDTSRTNENFFITCDNFTNSKSSSIIVVLEKRYNRLAVVDNGCVLFLIDNANGKFNLVLSHPVNMISKNDIKDLTNDGVKEIIQQGEERKCHNCSQSYRILNLKGGRVNSLFEAYGSYYCDGEIPPLSDHGYNEGDVMYEPIEVTLEDKNGDRIYEVTLNKSTVVYSGGGSDEEIQNNAISKTSKEVVVLKND